MCCYPGKEQHKKDTSRDTLVKHMQRSCADIDLRAETESPSARLAYFLSTLIYCPYGHQDIYRTQLFDLLAFN